MLDMIKKTLNTRAKYYVSAAFAGIILLFYAGVESVTVEVESTEVQNGEFIISVITGGELIARESRVITAPSNIRGQMQIVDIVPEGTKVKKGDFLLKFDVGELENKMLEQDNQMEELDLQREEMLAKQNSEMVQSEAQLQIQKYEHEQSKIRFELMKFEPEIKQRQQEIDMKKADLNLLEAQEEINRLKIKQQQDLNHLSQRIKSKQDDIDKIQEQIDAAYITAPIEGMVVYKENYMAGENEKLRVGQNVHRRMQLLELPDLSVMKVKTSVNEVDISKIRRGQEVIINMDANETTYYGNVTEIARLARNEDGAGNVKVFDVEVTIKNNDETIKPGMSATCTIVTERITTSLFIPLQSVFEEEGQTFVFLDGSYDKQPIEIGARNSDFIVVNSGLIAGQKITLRNPFSQLEVIGDEMKDKPSVTKSSAARNNSNSSSSRGRMMMHRR